MRTQLCATEQFKSESDQKPLAQLCFVEKFEDPIALAMSSKKRSYTVKPTGRPGGYPGSAPVAPPPGGAGMGGYPGATLGHPAPQYPGAGECLVTLSQLKTLIFYHGTLCDLTGSGTGNGEKLSSSQGEPGQAINRLSLRFPQFPVRHPVQLPCMDK